MEPKAYGAIKCTYCRKSNLVDGFETSEDDGEIKLNNGHLSGVICDRPVYAAFVRTRRKSILTYL